MTIDIIQIRGGPIEITDEDSGAYEVSAHDDEVLDESLDLILMGSRGLAMDKTWVLDLVSSRVVEEANCPVLVV